MESHWEKKTQNSTICSTSLVFQHQLQHRILPKPTQTIAVQRLLSSIKRLLVHGVHMYVEIFLAIPNGVNPVLLNTNTWDIFNLTLPFHPRLQKI